MGLGLAALGQAGQGDGASVDGGLVPAQHLVGRPFPVQRLDALEHGGGPQVAFAKIEGPGGQSHQTAGRFLRAVALGEAAACVTDDGQGGGGQVHDEQGLGLGFTDGRAGEGHVAPGMPVADGGDPGGAEVGFGAEALVVFGDGQDVGVLEGQRGGNEDAYEEHPLVTKEGGSPGLAFHLAGVGAVLAVAGVPHGGHHLFLGGVPGHAAGAGRRGATAQQGGFHAFRGLVAGHEAGHSHLDERDVAGVHGLVIGIDIFLRHVLGRPLGHGLIALHAPGHAGDVRHGLVHQGFIAAQVGLDVLLGDARLFQLLVGFLAQVAGSHVFPLELGEVEAVLFQGLGSFFFGRLGNALQDFGGFVVPLLYLLLGFPRFLLPAAFLFAHASRNGSVSSHRSISTFLAASLTGFGVFRTGDFIGGGDAGHIVFTHVSLVDGMGIMLVVDDAELAGRADGQGGRRFPGLGFGTLFGAGIAQGQTAGRSRGLGFGGRGISHCFLRCCFAGWRRMPGSASRRPV
nr:MAG TPA: hypothetical protein [Caudoviricetes sp.]